MAMDCYINHSSMRNNNSNSKKFFREKCQDKREIIKIHSDNLISNYAMKGFLQQPYLHFEMQPCFHQMKEQVQSY